MNAAARRILLAVDFYPPTIGGMEKHVQRLAEALAKLGWDVHVATLSSNATSTVGVTVHRVAGWTQRAARLHASSERPFPPPMPDHGLVMSLKNVIDEVQPDIVHAHGWISFSAAKARSTIDIPLIITVHDSGLICAKRTRYDREQAACVGPSSSCFRCSADHYGVARGTALVSALALGKPSLRYADRVLCVSSELAEASGPVLRGVPIEVIPNFSAPAPSRPGGRQRPDFLPDGDVVLYVGTLAPFRGIDDLLAVWKTRAPAAQLVLVGSNPEGLPAVMPEGVHVVLDAPHHHVLDAFSHAALAVLPSRFPEPSPTVVLEAFSHGCPVVATAIGGIPDMVIDNVSGRLVPPNNPARLGLAIEELLADPCLRGRLGTQAKEHGGRYHQDVVVPQIAAAYETTLSKGPTSLEVAA